MLLNSHGSHVNLILSPMLATHSLTRLRSLLLRLLLQKVDKSGESEGVYEERRRKQQHITRLAYRFGILPTLIPNIWSFLSPLSVCLPLTIYLTMLLLFSTVHACSMHYHLRLLLVHNFHQVHAQWPSSSQVSVDSSDAIKVNSTV